MDAVDTYSIFNQIWTLGWQLGNYLLCLGSKPLIKKLSNNNFIHARL